MQPCVVKIDLIPLVFYLTDAGLDAILSTLTAVWNSKWLFDFPSLSKVKTFHSSYYISDDHPASSKVPRLLDFAPFLNSNARIYYLQVCINDVRAIRYRSTMTNFNLNYQS